MILKINITLQLVIVLYKNENCKKNNIYYFNLFLFRFITNILIIYTDHIFYAWAIHFGWNVIFLRNIIQTNFNEPKLFNAFIGTKQMLLFLLVLLLLSFIIIFYRRKVQHLNSL